MRIYTRRKEKKKVKREEPEKNWSMTRRRVTLRHSLFVPGSGSLGYKAAAAAATARQRRNNGSLSRSLSALAYMVYYTYDIHAHIHLCRARSLRIENVPYIARAFPRRAYRYSFQLYWFMHACLYIYIYATGKRSRLSPRYIALPARED